MKYKLSIINFGYNCKVSPNLVIEINISKFEMFRYILVVYFS